MTENLSRLLSAAAAADGGHGEAKAAAKGEHGEEEVGNGAHHGVDFGS